MKLYYNADPQKLKKRFGRKKEIVSKYETQFPNNAEREYNRLARDINKEFQKHVDSLILWRFNNIPLYLPDLEAVNMSSRLSIIARLLMRFAIRQWQLSVGRTLGIEINKEYHENNLALKMHDWAVEQKQDIEQKLRRISGDIRFYEYFGLIGTKDFIEHAEIKKKQVLSALYFISANNIGEMFSDIMEYFCRDSGVEKYQWATKGDALVRPDHEELDGGIFEWDNPPIVNQATGETGHPGDDYNCRCVAVPVFASPVL